MSDLALYQALQPEFWEHFAEAFTTHTVSAAEAVKIWSALDSRPNA